MRRVLLLLVLLPLFIFAQGDVYFSPVFDISEASEGLASITQNDLRAHLTFLASDAAEGRETGEPGLQVAAEYIAAQFRRLGLTPLDPDQSFFQKYEIIKSKLGEDPQLTLLYEQGEGWVREAFQYEEDFFLSSRGLTSSLEVQVPVVFAGYGIVAQEYNWDDYASIDVSHEIVLMIDGEPELSDPDLFLGDEETHYADVRAKVKTAKEKGAAAIVVAFNPKSAELFSEKYKRWKRWLHRQSMSLVTSEAPVPLFFVNNRTADRILAVTGKSLQEHQLAMEQGGTPDSQTLSGRFIHFAIHIEKESTVAQNVVAYFPGNNVSVGQETIIISAHYDHLGKSEDGTIWHGADDNATGTSALLEIAEAVVANSALPQRGFLFVAMSGEEKGLLGSRYYTTHPLIPLSNTVADLNIDMVGRNAPDSIYIIGSNMISQDLHEINEFAASKIDELELNYRYNSLDDPSRFYFRSDHYNFASREIPVIFYFAGIHKDYHKPTDTLDKINFEKLRKVARLVFLTGWGVAQNEVRPRKNAGELPEIPDKIKF